MTSADVIGNLLMNNQKVASSNPADFESASVA